MTRPGAHRILAVDDEQDILDLLSYNLSKEGYDVGTALNGDEALRKIRTKSFDLVILDLMMPGLQGVELCHILRNDPGTKNLPIIILTAKTEEVDRVLGLEIGADDYITKPFSPRELIARIKAVMRRSKRAAPAGEYITIGELTINTSTYTASKKNIPISLSPTEFRLLLYLFERRGKIFNREQLLRAVWKDERNVESRTVDVHINRIRAQIEDDPANPVYIKTRRGHGYYFEDALPEGD
jgi:DNA-binding response OmpR family regulator